MTIRIPQAAVVPLHQADVRGLARALFLFPFTRGRPKLSYPAFTIWRVRQFFRGARRLARGLWPVPQHSSETERLRWLPVCRTGKMAAVAVPDSPKIGRGGLYGR